MSVQLKEYQDIAVGELSEGLKALLDNPASDKICVFKAPTGSGKTVMAAKFIERFILENPDRDVCFIWLSVASGDLDGQSKDSLKSILEGAPHVGLVEEEFTGGRRIIGRSEIVVASWQKLFLRNRQTLEWKNVLMKDGENVNFREVLTATRAKRKIILIVDESHIGKNAPRTNELREVISADVEIEMSATPIFQPSLDQIGRGEAKVVVISSADVIRAGVIKKEIIINEGLSAVSDEEADSQTMVLEAAYAKRNALQAMFIAEGSAIKPLVLVQVPNAAEGEAKIEAVKVLLAGKGITEVNGRLAVWLSDEKSDHLDTVKDNGSLIEFLIFKQAVATGWDCPRAHILVRFREIEGYVFEMQTVGRILRMPELRHYDTEALNRGYIFTNLRGITVDSREETSRIIKSLHAQRQASWTALDVPTYFRKRFDYKDITAGFDSVFEKVFCKELGLDSEEFFEKNRKSLENKGLMVDINTLRDDIISDGVVPVLGIDEAQCDVPGAEVAHFSLAPNDVATMFDRMIRRHLGPFKSFKRSIPKVMSDN